MGSKGNFFLPGVFLTKFVMFLSKNGISQSAKQFHKVDLDLQGQSATFFFQAFFDQNFHVFVKKTAFREVLNNFEKWIQTCGVKTQLFSSKRFLTKILMFSSKTGNCKHLHRFRLIWTNFKLFQNLRMNIISMSMNKCTCHFNKKV